MRRGFTLIETLAALVIVGLVAVAAMAAVGGALRMQRRARQHVEAVALVELRLGELAASPVDSLLQGDGTRAGAFAAPYARYRWRSSVRYSNESTALLTASVVVEWNEGEYGVATLLYRPEAEIGGSR